jgi:DNA-binding transcriptional LysR family regulator
MSDSNFNLNLLHAFYTLYEEKNVTRAGKTLNITQSAMSNSLNQMREQFGDPLFVREKYGMKPTPRATKIALKLQPILAQIDQVINVPDSFDPATTTRVFTIAVTNIISYLVLPHLIERFKMQAPHARLHIKDCDPFYYDQNYADQFSVELCAGLAGKLPTTTSCEEVFRVSAVTVARRDHPLMQGELTLEKYLEAKHLLINVTGYKHPTRVEEALDALGQTRNIYLSVPYPAIASRILVKSDLITTIPEQLLSAFSNIHELAVQPTPLDIEPTNLVQVWHSRFDNDPGHMWLRELIKDAGAVNLER